MLRSCTLGLCVLFKDQSAQEKEGTTLLLRKDDREGETGHDGLANDDRFHFLFSSCEGALVFFPHCACDSLVRVEPFARLMRKEPTSFERVTIGTGLAVVVVVRFALSFLIIMYHMLKMESIGFVCWIFDKISTCDIVLKLKIRKIFHFLWKQQ